MNTELSVVSGGCACCLTRRRFLTGCAACAAAASVIRPSPRESYGEEPSRLRIRLIFALHGPVQEGPDWPNKGFDFRPVMARIEQTLKNGCPNMDFLPAMANGPEAAAKIVEEDKANPPDGYIVYQMNCWNRVVQTIAETGKPVLYVDFQFGGSGGFLVYTASFLRQNKPNVAFVASSNMDDHVAAARCFQIVKNGGSAADFVAAVTKIRREKTPAPGDLTSLPDPVNPLSPEDTLKVVKEAKILAVGGGWPGISNAIQKDLGVPVISIPFEELNKAWETADKDQAREIADRWQKTAALIEGVSRETLEQSAAMYLAEKALLQAHGANAITINCLGGFYGGHIHAYPCLGYYELNNSGLIGACECDLRSTITMVVMTAMTQGRPGFISDPVIDTAKRQIIYAHCVASNRVFGPKGPANPFQILTHSEDRQGASVRSLMPEGYMTTTVELAPERKQILFHQAKSVGNSLDDRACRTKLCGEPVGDIEKLFTQWDAWGWHRVTVYGDLKEAVFALADKLGWSVIQEA
ncbi:twin-arginine translocation signal domain-containing protein [Thermogutta sp.]|uniref:twin-arginine translocation signal domain-containing protein n=1 Tax=Thermogutta sp. TaxID=1962930 RepID=UPI003220562C